jgi:hypothetical protein
MYERWLLYFPPYRCSQCLNISKLTGDRTLGMRRLQKVANDIRQDTDTGVGQLTKDDDRGGVWRVAAFGACSRLAAAPHLAGNRPTVECMKDGCFIFLLIVVLNV